MQRKTLSEQLEAYESALKDHGLGYSSRLYAMRDAMSIIQRHREVGAKYLDGQIISDFIGKINERFYNGEIGKNQARNTRRTTERFVRFVQTGEVQFENTLKGSHITLLPEFQCIADKFLASEDFHPNTRNDIRWAVYKYFDWLASQGYRNLQGVGAEQIQKFLLDCSEKMAMGSVYDIKLYLRKLYAYLYKSEQSESSYQVLLSFKVNRGTKMQPVLQKDEIAAMLGTINRKTAAGKRAYAVMLLGTVLGLRACDIINLKRTDIDWTLGEIRILQSKTARTVVLPLTKDVGEALEDYILNARRNSGTPQIFLRLSGAVAPLRSAVTIAEIYRDCCVAAGLLVSKKFHTLRRSLGTSMLASGSPVTMVAQVLGHSDVDSTKKYIASDYEHMKMCAMPFDGIAPATAEIGGAR
jgi:site-specific recombinase XerD